MFSCMRGEAFIRELPTAPSAKRFRNPETAEYQRYKGIGFAAKQSHPRPGGPDCCSYLTPVYPDKTLDYEKNISSLSLVP